MCVLRFVRSATTSELTMRRSSSRKPRCRLRYSMRFTICSTRACNRQWQSGTLGVVVAAVAAAAPAAPTTGRPKERRPLDAGPAWHHTTHGFALLVFLAACKDAAGVELPPPVARRLPCYSSSQRPCT